MAEVKNLSGTFFAMQLLFEKQQSTKLNVILAGRSTMVHYLIIGVQRSGTTAIHKALMRHPQVSVLTDELRVSPLFNLGIRTFTFGSETSEERAAARQAIFNTITTLLNKPDVTHCGAKTCIILPFAAKGIVHALRMDFPKMKIVFVKREDIVAQYGSTIHAKKSGVYHSWNKGANSMQVRKLYLNPLQFILYALDCLEVNRTLFDLSKSHDLYKVVYERFCNEPIEELESICKFLGLQDIQIGPDSRKLMPPPESYITNYSALKEIEAWVRRRHSSGKIPKSLQILSNMHHWAKALKLKFQLLSMTLDNKKFGMNSDNGFLYI